MSLSGLRGKLLLSLALGLVVVVALMVYGDLSKLSQALGGFQWRYLPLILGLTLMNYLLRFIKWEFYLRNIGVAAISRTDSLFIFFSGLSMVITPGKVGEWLKSYLLKQVTSTPVSSSAPIIIAERLSDALAMVLLAGGGVFLFGLGWQVALAAVLVALIFVAMFRYRPLALRFFSIAQRLPLISGRMSSLMQFYQSSHVLFGPRNLLIAVTLGFFSWLGECIAFYFVLLGLGIEGGGLLVVQATFILAVSTLAGAMLLVPGGLGVAEGGITGLCQFLLDMPRGAAAAATLLIRLCTLWFGVAIGIAMLLLISRRLELEPSPGQQSTP